MGTGMARERLDFRFEYAAPRRACKRPGEFLSRPARFYLAEARHGVMPGEIRSLGRSREEAAPGSDFEANASPYQDNMGKT